MANISCVCFCRMHAALTRKRGGLVRGFTDYDLYANVEIYLGVLNLILNRIEFFSL